MTRVSVPLLVLLAVALAGDVSAQASWSIATSGGRVSVVANDAPLGEILRELARRTGSRVVGLEQATERVTVDIRDAHVLDAIRALLAEVRVNYLYVPRRESTGSNERVALWLYGASASRAGAAPIVVDATEPGADVVPELAGYLPQWPDNEVSRLTREGAFDSKATQASLLGLAKSPDPDVRVLALQTLALQPTAATKEAIRAALRDENIFVRGEATVLATSFGGAEAVEHLGGLLEDDSAEVRGAATLTLADQTGEEAARLIERALRDSDSGVRGLAAQAQRQQSGQKRKQ